MAGIRRALYLYTTLTTASIGTFSTSPENESNDVVPNMVLCNSNQLPQQPRPGFDNTRLRGRLPAVPCFRGSSRGGVVCTRRQRGSGVGSPRASFGNQFLTESNDCQDFVPI